MTHTVFHGPSPHDSDPPDAESFTVLYQLTVEIAHYMFPDAIGPADEDDVAQEASLKIWIYWKFRSIDNPPAFIRRAVYTVAIDLMRKLKPSLYQQFPRNEFDEIREDELIWLGSGDETDPEWIAVNDEQLAETIENVASAIAALKERQQDAALCTLKQRIDVRQRMDEWSNLVAALAARGINADREWPDSPQEKQRLQASYSPARRNIARSLGVDLSPYKRP